MSIDSGKLTVAGAEPSLARARKITGEPANGTMVNTDGDETGFSVVPTLTLTGPTASRGGVASSAPPANAADTGTPLNHTAGSVAGKPLPITRTPSLRPGEYTAGALLEIT